ncbi:MAG: hypothetical protein JWL64_2581, partial [Frankiales bacterium]|nr:hypothetical protein [Frankiales bacterium]
MTEEELAGTAGASTTAAGVDDLLLWEATARADALLADLTPGRTTKNGLVALLSYLREVVLARITEEDRYALPALSGRGSAGVAAERLRLEHLALREDIEALAEAAAARGPVEQDALADLTRQLIERLERHLRHEAATLEAAPEGSDRSPGWV